MSGIIMPDQLRVAQMRASGESAVPGVATMNSAGGPTFIFAGGFSKRETIAMHLLAALIVLPEERFVIDIDGKPTKVSAAEAAITAADELLAKLALSPDPNAALYQG